MDLQGVIPRIRQKDTHFVTFEAKLKVHPTKVPLSYRLYIFMELSQLVLCAFRTSTLHYVRGISTGKRDLVLQRWRQHSQIDRGL